jgi:tetratricopeptide (TPR) repeat protein
MGGVLQQQGKWDAALAAYRKAVKFRQDFAPAHNNIGLLLMQQGKLAEAEAAFRRAIELQPTLPVPYDNLGRLLANDLARRKEAMACFDKALALDDHFASLYNDRGFLWFRMGDLDKAIADFQQALRLDDRDVEALYNLGSAQTVKKQYAEAVASLQTALRIDPKIAESHYRMGITYSNWGRELAAKGMRDESFAQLDKAIAKFNDTIALNKEYADAWYSLGNASRDRGHIQAAIAAFEKTTVLKPKSADANFNLGNLLLKVGQYPRAVKAYQAALAANPDYLAAYTNLGYALSEQGAFVEAQKTYSQFLARKRDDPRGSANLAGALSWQGRYGEALAVVTQARDKLPAGSEPRKHLEGMVQQYRQFVDLEGKLPAILNGRLTPASTKEKLLLGEICLTKKWYAAAAGFYKEALVEQPDLAANLSDGYRYDAARAAVLAGSGQGEDLSPTQAGEQVRWRKQALAWLQADLALCARTADQRGPLPPLSIIQTLQRLRHHVHFSGVRGAAIANLPPDERAAWHSLWVDVDTLLKRIPVP